MNDMEFEALQKVIAAVLGMDTDEIALDMDFVDDLGADSLDLYQIFTGVEDALDIAVPPEEVERIRTVREAVELIRLKM